MSKFYFSFYYLNPLMKFLSPAWLMSLLLLLKVYLLCLRVPPVFGKMRKGIGFGSYLCTKTAKFQLLRIIKIDIVQMLFFGLHFLHCI